MRKKIYQILEKLATSKPYIKWSVLSFFYIFILMCFVVFFYENFLQDKNHNLAIIKNVASEISKKKPWDKETMNKYTLYKRLKNMKYKERADIFKFINDAQRKSKVDLEFIRPKEKEPHDIINYETYKVSASGVFGSLVGFLRDISDIPIVIAFSDVLIEPVGEVEQDDERILRLSLEIDIYRDEK